MSLSQKFQQVLPRLFLVTIYRYFGDFNNFNKAFNNSYHQQRK